MQLNNQIPSVFATSLAEAAGLVMIAKPGHNHHEYTAQVSRLRAFQQMAVVVPFEEALISYHGQKLTKAHKAVLEVVYKSTKPWMLGHVVGVLLDKLDDRRMANKDFAESIKTIIEQLTKDDGTDGPGERLRGLMVTLTK
jgi:hypothetical protein